MGFPKLQKDPYFHDKFGDGDPYIHGKYGDGVPIFTGSLYLRDPQIHMTLDFSHLWSVSPVSQEMLSLGNSVAATRYPRILCRLDK